MRVCPRLSRALIAYSDVGGKFLDPRPKSLPEKLAECNAEEKWGVNWQEFCLQFPKDVHQNLHKLHQLISKILDGHPMETVTEVTIFTLRLLMTEDVITEKTKSELRDVLGNVTPEFYGNATKLIKATKEKLSEEGIEKFFILKKKRQSICESNIYGSKVKYNDTKFCWPNLSRISDMLPGNRDTFSKFTMVFEQPTKEPEKTEFCKDHLIRGLKQCFEKYNTEMSYEEFIRMVLSKLKLPESIAESELFDLLGYENFELTGYVIKNKSNILAMQGASKTSKIFDKILNQPQVASSVIVQSENEKKLIKQVRKEEKKLQKVSSKTDNSANIEASGRSLSIKKKEAVSAMRAPLFPDIPKVASSAYQEKYPFVFDSKLSAKNAAGFVSGVKLMLPESVTRKDSSLCEEVQIPVPDVEPLQVGNDPIFVATLDQVGQKAFEGIQKLNRIQTIVFDAAYNTNENLLICAPTGAGKTNIAMLTVVHQLKLHLDMGVLRKHEFKIIYIAPMKALAAEMTANFSKRLSSLGVSVKELTGDMQLTKSEIQETQMIVTTPEKWDVVTRKGTGDIALTSIVRLLIIDEVHLLHGDRGPVVEALVARTLRQVESSQSMIRIVGLSATLPNYLDVARFLRVNPYKGLFYFDHRFRPVPLSQTFIGVKSLGAMQQMSDMDQVCYNQVVDMVRKGRQVMVFVFARNATIRTATMLKDKAIQNQTIKLFGSDMKNKMAAKAAASVFQNSRNRHLSDLFANGICTHHAGMSRADRNTTEKYFAEGYIKVLVCTSTLAWGVNLPAHAVIIRGTEIYDAKRSSFIDLGILDVLQIFGRAGRPQFNTSGHATIITSHNKLAHYLSLLTNQFPIESSFIECLADNLNAEVALGTVSNVSEAVEWLSYTYLFVRMRLNPTVYGILHTQLMDDMNLERKRKELITSAAMSLDKAKMLRFNSATGDLNSTDLGRIASHYYLKYDTIEIFNEMMSPIMTEADILAMVSHSQEFQQTKIRNEELDELDELLAYCEVVPKGGTANVHGKVNILMQTYLSRGQLDAFSLISDQSYIIQNAIRIMRALFEIMLRRNNALVAAKMLTMAKMMELQQWEHLSPLRQFVCLPGDIITKIEDRSLTIDRIKDMHVDEIGRMLHNQRMADVVKKCCQELPCVELEATLQPITRTVLRIRISIIPRFHWNDRVHGKNSEAFWMWIEDPESNFIYHHEYFQLPRKSVYMKTEQEIVMTIPLTEPLPSQYIVKVVSDRWLGCENMLPLSFKNLILPETRPPHTDLLELQPLSIKALKDSRMEKLYKFSSFNLIQTQIFHCLFHTDNNVLLGAPTGSGKTIAAEIAMFRVFQQYPALKVVYIAPMKALVRERMKDWKVRLEQGLGKRVVELTGDVTPDARSIAEAGVIVTTPEKWDGISRSWQTRNYVRQVALIIIDEIHLLGEDRGPVLEVIVSRTNLIASNTKRTLRIIGLSTAVANATDLADWLGIKKMGLYNFRPSVRPVPLEVHISGFPGKHYCPRMATMNKPAFQAIRQHAPHSPSLIFVSSRRQTRLTALDLIAYLAAEDNPKQWLHMPENEMDSILSNIKDSNLKLTLAFGIGLHHAGLQDRDRNTVEELFANAKIQVLIATATLAWGVNFPAHLVVIKGTEYYDGKAKRYVDMPITDVLQMMGRAGRPQFDESGVAVVLVHDVKKSFYKKFLYEPFPVESSLLDVLPDHINAEIVAGTIKSKQEFIDYLTWTYFFRRLLKNPKYYGLDALEPKDVNAYLSQLVEDTVKELTESACVYFDEEEQSLIPLAMGKIASFYYISHHTIRMFEERLAEDLPLEQYLRIMCNAYEYDQLPVRHNEDLLNEKLAKECRYKPDRLTYDSPNTKAFLLLQAHFSRLEMPCSDYLTDLKSVMDQSIRILQAMIDVVAERGWIIATLRIVQIMQMTIQARWFDDSALTTLPHVERHHLHLFESSPKCLPVFCSSMVNDYAKLSKLLLPELTENQVHKVREVMKGFPDLRVNLVIEGEFADGQTRKEFHLSSKKCIELRKHVDYNLVITAKRKNRSQNLKVHSPFFQKGKDEGWFFILADIKSRQLLALKRASNINGPEKTNNLLFSPNDLGTSELVFFIMSDSYLGLDQQYKINIKVVN